MFVRDHDVNNRLFSLFLVGPSIISYHEIMMHCSITQHSDATSPSVWDSSGSWLLLLLDHSSRYSPVPGDWGIKSMGLKTRPQQFTQFTPAWRCIQSTGSYTKTLELTSWQLCYPWWHCRLSWWQPAVQVVIMTTCSATRDNKVGIMTTLGYNCHWPK